MSEFIVTASRFYRSRERYKAICPWISIKARKRKVSYNSRLKVPVH
jgi:uncharacterized membrane protein